MSIFKRKRKEIVEPLESDGDKNITAVAWISYMFRNPTYILLAMFFISIAPFVDFIVTGFQTSYWYWDTLGYTLITATTSFILYIFQKTSERESREVLNRVRQSYEDDFDKLKKECKDIINELNTKIEKLEAKNSELLNENIAFKGKVQLQEYMIKNPLAGQP